MFPETDELSNIISDTIKVVFKRRLVDRVLRLWTELARGQGFPSRDQIEPSKLGVDWRNCLVIAVQSPVQLSYLAAAGENLSFTHCPADSLEGVLLSHVPQVLLPGDRGPGEASGGRYPLSERPLSVSGRRYRNRPPVGRSKLPPVTRT